MLDVRRHEDPVAFRELGRATRDFEDAGAIEHDVHLVVLVRLLAIGLWRHERVDPDLEPRRRVHDLVPAAGVEEPLRHLVDVERKRLGHAAQDTSLVRLDSWPMPEGVTRARIDFASDERFAALRRDLGVTSFGLNVLTLEPRQRGRIHRHEQQEEVYVVLAGALTLALEGDELELAEGDAVRVEPSVRRQLVNRGTERVVLLAIGGAGEHVGRDGEAFEDWSSAEGRPPQDVPLPDDLPA